MNSENAESPQELVQQTQNFRASTGEQKDARPRVLECFEDVVAVMEGDVEFFFDLAEICLRTSPRYLTEMRNAFVEKDRVTIVRAAHTLKGSMRVLGLKSTADAAYELELKAKDRPFEELGHLIQKVEQSYCDADQLLKAACAYGKRTN